jgi:hypothetical protein
MKQIHDKEKLEQFLRTVAHLTKNHRCLRLVTDMPNDNDEHTYADLAWVSPKELGDALAAVDPNWWK